MITNKEVLEVLYRAEARLVDPDVDYDYVNGRRCTCGHIYAAIDGSIGSPFGRPHGVYAEVIMATARALGFRDGRDACAAAWYVSDLHEGVSVDVHEGLRVLRQAIATIEAQQERDRLDVLAQARAVVDDAEVREQVPA